MMCIYVYINIHSTYIHTYIYIYIYTCIYIYMSCVKHYTGLFHQILTHFHPSLPFLADLIFFFRFFLAAGLRTALVSCQLRKKMGHQKKALSYVGWFINPSTLVISIINNHKIRVITYNLFFKGFLDQ